MARTRRLAAIALFLAASLLGAGCHHGADVPGPSDGARLDFTTKAEVKIDDNGITPSSLHLHVGDAITVANQGTRDHGLTGKAIDTGTLRPSESTVLYLTAAGKIDAYDRDAPDHKIEIDVSSESA